MACTSMLRGRARRCEGLLYKISVHTMASPSPVDRIFSANGSGEKGSQADPSLPVTAPACQVGVTVLLAVRLTAVLSLGLPPALVAGNSLGQSAA